MIESSSTTRKNASPRRRWWQWRNRTRFIFTLVVTMIVWCAVDVRLRGRVDPNNPTAHRTDFTVYTEAGAAFFDGRDPYTVTNPRGWGYLYPPLFAMVVAPLHAFDYQMQVVVWFTISVLLAWGCYRESVRIAVAVMPDEPRCGPFGPVPAWIGCLAVAAATLPALNCLQRGQVGILKLYLLLLGFRLLVANPDARSKVTGPLVGGCVLALPIVLKVTPLITVGYVLFALLAASMRERHLESKSRVVVCGAGVAIGLTACLFVIPALAVGWQANWHHLQSWTTSAAKNAHRSTEGELAGDSYSVRNQSLSNAVCRFGNWAHHTFADGPRDSGGKPDAEGKRGLIMESDRVAWWLRVACAIEGGLLLLATWRVASGGNAKNLAAVFGMACVSTLVVAPIARGHYYLLFLPAVMFVTPWLLAHGRRILAIEMAIVPFALLAAHYLQMTTVGRVGLLGIGTACWFTTGALSMIWLGPLASEHAGALAPEFPRLADLPNGHSGSLRAQARDAIPLRAGERGKESRAA